MKKLLITAAMLVLSTVLLSGCGAAREKYYKSLEQYPNSGEIEFGDITLTIPDGYIRDSTMEGTKEGYARRWEKGMYKKIVTISKHSPYEISEETIGYIEENQKEISSTGEIEIQLIDFNGGKAIESRIPMEDGELVYLIFNTEETGYDFSVQGNTEDYEMIRDSIVY